MSFYYRVFATVEKDLWGNEIEAFLEERGIELSCFGVVDEDDEENLDARPVQILFCDPDGREVATLEYDALEGSDFLAEEIEEFQDCVEEMLPERNRKPISLKLSQTVGCYCFTISDAGFEIANWDRVASVAAWLREETNGIEQTDDGQITNERGEVALIVPLDDEEDDEEEDDDAHDDAFDEEDDEDLDDEDLDDEEDDEEDDEDEIDEFVGAIWTGGEWKTLLVQDDESLDKFLRGEA